MSQEKRLQALENRLLKLDADRVSLLREIQNLREEVAKESETTRPLLGRPIAKSELSTNTEKVRLFLNLFRARQDFFPKRWENTKTGKSGYSPACANEWVKPLCEKPKVKCADCSNQNLHHLMSPLSRVTFEELQPLAPMPLNLMTPAFFLPAILMRHPGGRLDRKSLPTTDF